MKSKFLKDFVKFLSQIPDPLPGLFIRESMHYKYLRLGGHDPKRIYDGFKNLENRRVLKKVPKGFLITKSGSRTLRKSIFQHLSLNDEKWDGKWRVLIFDIPESLKKQREAFRNKLKSLGFYSLQKSVFVLPYKCEEELGFITKYLGIGEYIDMILASKVGFKEEELKEYFGL